MKVIYIINPHSVIDVITNSSTELFVVDGNKVEEGFKEVFRVITKEISELDFETTITKYNDFDMEEGFRLPSEIKDTSNLWVIHASQHNTLLNTLIERYFNPIRLIWD